MPNYKRSRVGLPRGKTRPKSHVTYTQQVGSLVPQSTLKSVEINAIDRSTDDRQTTRQGNEIDVSGVRIMTYSRNPIALPIYLKMYVCTYIGQDSLTNPKDQLSDPVPTDNFYRGKGNARAANFNGVSRSGFSRYQHDINTDSWAVLWGTTLWLNPTEQSGVVYDSERGTNWKILQKYIPIKRRVTYDDDSPTTVPTNGRLFLVWFWDTMQRSAAETTGSNMELGIETEVYFHDPY